MPRFSAFNISAEQRILVQNLITFVDKMKLSSRWIKWIHVLLNFMKKFWVLNLLILNLRVKMDIMIKTVSNVVHSMYLQALKIWMTKSKHEKQLNI